MLMEGVGAEQLIKHVGVLTHFFDLFIFFLGIALFFSNQHICVVQVVNV